MKGPGQRRSLRRAALVVLCGALAAGSFGQWTVPKTEAPPGIHDLLEARAVDLAVSVTDPDGVRVPGLDRDDFRMAVDGKPRPIEHFAEVRDGRLVGPSEGPAADGPLAGTAAGAPVSTSYLLFVDDTFSIEADRDGVLRAIEDGLALLPPQDRVAIVSFDGESLALLTSFTRAENELRSALARARARPAQGLERLAERKLHDDHLREAARSPAGPDPAELDGLTREYALRLADQVRASVLASCAVMRALARPSGRKVMILLSGGWPFSPAEFALDPVLGTFGAASVEALDAEVPGRAELYGPLVDTANLLSYTIYPVDVPGPQQGDETEERALEAAPPIGFAREDQLERSLLFLAEQTGGDALLDTRRNRALEWAIEDTRSYYWLRTSHERREDDARHPIDVAALRSGLRADARRSWMDMSSARALEMAAESALSFGSVGSHRQLPVSLGERRRAGERSLVTIGIDIPLEAVAVTLQGGRHRAWLELRIRAIGPQGALSGSRAETLFLDEEGPPAAEQVLSYDTELELGPDTERVVVTVYDPLSGVILSRVVHFDEDRPS